ncbi:MAG TPA: hypothetical protein VKA26_10020 [Ignavibacteriaceae bacterium]|nr:hypothetical protein [Ignavibacteriaceae bacterium]
MKKTSLTLASLLMLIFFSGSSYEPGTGLSFGFISTDNSTTTQKEQKIHKEFKVESGKLLNLNCDTGASINVEGWDKDIVSIDAELGGRDWEDININFDKSSSGVTITTEYERHQSNRSSKVDFTIKVPKKFDLKFETMGGGVDLNNLEGELKGTTMGGSMILKNLKGNLSLKTMGGKIKLTNSDVDGKVSTMGGEVNIENVTGNVDGKSMGGNVTINNLKRRDGNSIGKEVHISTMGGAIDLNTAPFGANVHTMGGDITINSAEKFVKAKTMGGDIVIKTVNGRVNATTMGGDIKVTETGTGDDRDIELKSMSGDITLYVPSNFSMEVIAKITYNKEDHGDYQIISDFNLDESTKTESQNNHWNINEILTGSGSFNGGKNNVIISTIVGNIYIKKIN